MPPKLYFDHDVNLTVLPDLRADGYDVKTTPEAKNERASDEKQLDYATREGRVIVTYNRKDFRRLHRRYLSRGKEHAGILVSKQLPRDQLLLRLQNFLQQVTGDHMRNRLENLGDYL